MFHLNHGFDEQLSPGMTVSPSAVSIAANSHPSLNLDEDDQEQEVLIEPRFKYHRVVDTSKVLPDRDTISCFVVHDKFIVVGCASGKIRIFDILGNLRKEYTQKKHKCSITKIAVDKSGNYLISCANDSIIAITGIGCNEFNYILNASQSARSVEIAENFIKKNCQKFVVGDRKLSIYEPSLFTKYSATVIFEGREIDGFITAISWKNDLIAFTNETGTRIYDLKIKKFLVLVQPLHTPEPYFSSRFPPVHSWFDNNTFAIGWASSVIVCNVKTPKSNENSIKNGQLKKIEIIHRIRLKNFHISGLSFTLNSTLKDGEKNWKEVAIFGIKVVEQKTKNFPDDTSTISQISGKSSRSIAQSVMAVPIKDGQQTSIVLMLALPRTLDEFIIAAEDEISMEQPEQTFLKQFHLGSIPEDSIYYLVGPGELIEAKPCSVDDRIQWFLSNEYYKEATNCAITHKDDLIETTVSDVGRKLIENLVEKNDFETAASYLSIICGKHKEEWEYYVQLFEKYGQVLKLVPYLPQKQPQLEPECYESVLTSALYSKSELFLKLIILLPSDLYRIGAIIQLTLVKLKSPLSREDRIFIIQALARLFAYERQYDKALALYLQLKDTGIFSFIRQYHLFSSVKNRVVELMEINPDLAIRLLLDHENEIADFKTIVPQLSKMPRIQMEYLNQLILRGEGYEYADLLVKLFAENSPERLLSFLRKSDGYDLDKAIDICKKKKLQHELVFLLGRSGNRMAALETIIEQMEKIDLGIEFCAEHTDSDLWQRLIELSMNKPEYVTQLLSVAGTFVDPLIVIQKIPSEMKIPNLQKSLNKVLRDSELQVSLIKDCLNVSMNDVYTKFDSFIKRPCIIVDNYNECHVCKKPLLGTEMILQECGHQFHVKCVKLPEKNPFLNNQSEELCQRMSFLAYMENDPGPFLNFCPICDKH